MASELLSSVLGGGGSIPKFRATTSGTIPSGTPEGDILTINAANGRLVRLKWLTQQGGLEVNMNIVIDGITVISNRSLTNEIIDAGVSTGYFGIATQEGSTSPIDASGLLTDVTGEQIIIQKMGASTTNTIQFTYEEIEP